MNRFTKTILLPLAVGLNPVTAMAHHGHHGENGVISGLLHMFIDHGYLLAGLALVAGIYYAGRKARD